MKCLVLTAIATLSLARPTFGAPYETVAIYTNISTPSSTKEVVIEDVMVSATDNVLLPSEFADTNASYRLTAIEQRLDVDGVDKSFFAPFLDTKVLAKADGVDVRASELLTKDHSSSTWSMTEIMNNRQTKPTVTISIQLETSFTFEYLCGLEEAQRQKNGKAFEDFKTLKLAALVPGIPPKVLVDKGRPILFSFCPASDPVHWDDVLSQTKAHPELSLDGEYADARQLRDAHRRALVGVLFGSSLPEGLDLVIPRFSGDPAKIVIRDTTNFSIVTTANVAINEITPDGPQAIGTIIDQDSSIQVDFSSYGMCGAMLSPPYSIAVIGADEKNNPVVMKAPHEGTPCKSSLTFKWSDYLGKTLHIELQYQLPGIGGTVVVAASNKFTVRQLGLIATLPVYSEIVAVKKAKTASDLTLTSSIPISWAIRLNQGLSGKYAAVTFPWKLSYNPRAAPELAKYLSIYPHVTIIFPTDDDTATTTTFAVGLGISVAQVFNFAYGFAPTDTSSYLLIGLSVSDIVKALK
ncbi:MAG: hypothetical protein QM831_31525 [Kofleriaceae bacterium]